MRNLVDSSKQTPACCENILEGDEAWAYDLDLQSPNKLRMLPRLHLGEVRSMPTVKEFTLTMDDKPGTLGKVCRALAERTVNIVAAQSFPSGGKSLTRFVFDDSSKARSVLDNERATYTETEVVKINLANRPGELARAAQKLGDASININYLYCGAEPNTNTPLIIFGVAEVGKAAPLLEQAAAAAGRG